MMTFWENLIIQITVITPSSKTQDGRPVFTHCRDISQRGRAGCGNIPIDMGRPY